MSQPSHSLCLSYSFSPAWLLAQVQTQVKTELTFCNLLIITFLSYCKPHCCAAHNSNRGPERLLAELGFSKCLNLAGFLCICSSKVFSFSASNMSTIHLSLLTSAFDPRRTTISYTFRRLPERNCSSMESQAQTLGGWFGAQVQYVFNQFLSLPTGECLTVCNEEWAMLQLHTTGT